MEFCPKCGSILVQKKKNFKCPRCGYTKKGKVVLTASEKIQEKNEIPIISEEIETHPIVDAVCKKCKNKKAYFWTLQTRASDEAETKFFKCTKCGHIWREYR